MHDNLIASKHFENVDNLERKKNTYICFLFRVKQDKTLQILLTRARLSRIFFNLVYFIAYNPFFNIIILNCFERDLQHFFLF